MPIAGSRHIDSRLIVAILQQQQNRGSDFRRLAHRRSAYLIIAIASLLLLLNCDSESAMSTSVGSAMKSFLSMFATCKAYAAKLQYGCKKKAALCFSTSH